MRVSRFDATGLVAIGLVEPIAPLPGAVRVVEFAVARVLEEMLDDLDRTAASEGRSMTHRLDALIMQPEAEVRGRLDQ